MKVLDLFSGIGGFSLGLERAGMETVAFCEIEEYPRKVLAKHWPGVPIYEDVRELTGEKLRQDGISVDVICGGFPCQDISTAGKKIGIEGDRSGMWSECARLLGEIRPRWAIFENSSNLIFGGGGEWIIHILRSVAALGYDAEWHCIPASALGAPHGRDRVWIICYPNNTSESGSAFNDEAQLMPRLCKSSRKGSDPKCRLSKLGWVMERAWRKWESFTWDGNWDAENSPLGMGVGDGVPSRMDRLRALGNAVVPQIPELIGRAIMETEKC